MVDLNSQESVSMSKKSKKMDQKNARMDVGIGEEMVIEELSVEPKISFDAFFRELLKDNPKIYPHHKAPMREYAVANGLEEATRTQFIDLFKSY